MRTVALNAGDEPYGSELAWIGDMVPDTGSVCNAQTCGSYLQSFDFPNYVSNFRVTGISTLNLQFTRQEFDFLNKYHGLFDSTDPDLRVFADHGGKLIIWQGWTDTGTSPYGALNYWDAVRRTMGAQAEDQFLKLYMIPGVFHCAGGPEGGARVDFFDPLMQWVEKGVAPGGATVNYFASATTVARTRPVFPFPTIAQYTGQGDVNSADNYVPAQPTQHFSDRLDWLDQPLQARPTAVVADGLGWTGWVVYERGARRVGQHRPWPTGHGRSRWSSIAFSLAVRF